MADIFTKKKRSETISNVKDNSSETKIVKTLSGKELQNLCSIFDPNYFIRMNEIPQILTSSKELQQKTLAVDLCSGTQTGIGIDVYRYDARDEKEGTPVNKDKYILSGKVLLKEEPPFVDHHLSNLPEFTRVMPITCSKCQTVFPTDASQNDIPWFNKARRHSWYHVYCPNCGQKVDIAVLRKNQFWALQG